MTEDELLNKAWALIANAGQGDWSKETSEWKKLAEEWRDSYFELFTPLEKYK